MAKMAGLHAELNELPDFEKGVQAERQRIVLMLQERGLMAEKQVSDGDGWSFGRYNELLDIIDLIQNSGESKEPS